MAKLNLNLVLSNVLDNAKSVVVRNGIGSQLVTRPAAILSHGRPEFSGPDMPEPCGSKPDALGAYRDADATRTGRSVRPAGRLLRRDLGLTARSAVAPPLADLGRPQEREWQRMHATHAATTGAAQQTGSR